MNDLHNSHRMGRIMLNGVAKGQTPKLNTGTRRQASDLCSNRQAHARRRQRERQTMKTKLQKLMKRGTATAVAVACSAWLCAGCDSGSFNSAKNRQAVVQKYSTEVWNLPGEKYRFIARKPDGSVWYVETLSTSQNLISAETELFSATK